MDTSHEKLEKSLKTFMDKLKYSLGLEYRNTDYSVQLVDRLQGQIYITAGETVNIKINTEHYLDSIKQNAFREDNEFKAKNPELAYTFRQQLEKSLRLVPKMVNTLSNPAVAPALVFNNETGKFKKIRTPIYEHAIEADIQYTNDYRSTAIHWKSGLLVREFGSSIDAAQQKARSKIIRLLQDDTIFFRKEDEFLRIDPHEDIIFDILLECKVLTQDEIIQLIDTLKKEYVKNE